MITPDKIPTLVRKTAEEMAGAFFEENKRSADFRKGYPFAEFYIAAQWPRYVEPACEALINYMTQPGVSDLVKEEIYDAVTGLREQQLPAAH